MTFTKNNQAQLALGLAFGFTMILALFAFVFNSSMNVREKIKLQQTTDYAALVAANSQRQYLNRIRDYNLAIEAEWFTALALQQIDHCKRPVYAQPQPLTLGDGETPFLTVEAIADAYLLSQSLSSDVPAFDDLDGPTLNGGEICQLRCAEYNEAVNKDIRQKYAEFRSIAEQAILNIILYANQDAYQYALHHFLQPRNLPWGLQMNLKEVLGEGYTVQDVLTAHNNQDLTRSSNDDAWGYDIVSENQNDPLFRPSSERRPFPVTQFGYTGYQNLSQVYVCQPTGKLPFPAFKNAEAKIVKTGTYETHFFTGVHYMPPANPFEQNQALTKRRITPDQFNEVETRVSDPSMFSRKIDISTRAAAKPFGGTFPRSVTTDLASMLSSMVVGFGDASTPDVYEEGAGKTFEGAKLFGIADEAELGGFEIFRADLEARVLDEQGNEQETWEIRRKDYLH